MSRSARLAILSVLLIALAIRIMALSISAPQDDAYITYHYARNIASGDGFVYNNNERVLGTTTPLFTLLMVPSFWLGIAPEVMAGILAIAADLSTCLLLFLLVRRSVGFLEGFLASLFYATFYITVAATGYGMETQVFVLLLVATFYLASTSRPMASAITSALAVLTRPEGLLIVAIGALAWTVRSLRRKQDGIPALPVLVFVVILAVWVVFSTAYFGSPVPNSLIAKSRTEGFVMAPWVEYFFTRNPVTLGFWLLFAAGSIVVVRQRSLVLCLLSLWTLAYVLFFLFGQPAFLAAWYYPPAVVGLASLAAVAIGQVVRIIPEGPLRSALPVLGWLSLCFLVLPRSWESERWWSQSVESVYRPMGLWLHDNTSAGSTVFIGDIGYVGYLSQRRILDAAALVSPEVWRYYEDHEADGESDIQLVREYQPEFAVLRLTPGQHKHWTESSFGTEYEPVCRFQMFGETDLRPSEDPALRYVEHEALRRSVPDYIVYQRRHAQTDD